MCENLKRIRIAVAIAAVLCFPTVQAEETGALLRWKNGDVLPGQLQASDAGTIRWASPYFLDDLVLYIKVLDSVTFPEQGSPPVNGNERVSTTEAFRVSTLSGDVWIADLIDSDNDTFLFSSKHHGQFRVNRSAVYMLERRVRPDSLFDGSQLRNWKLPKPERGVLYPAFPLDSVQGSSWFADPEGHPKTWIAKAEIFHAFNLPEHFEIELELASDAHPPNFAFALGKDLYQTLRLEIWNDELVAVQGVLFKSILAIQPEQRNVRLRLTYDKSPGVLNVFDTTGNLLLKLEGVEPTGKDSGIYIQNRGKDLTVRRVKVYRQLKESAAQRINFLKPRVYLTNGERIQGKLFVQKDGAYVLNTDGTRRDIDLRELNHIVQPVQPRIPSIGLDQSVTLKYPDEVVLHGKLMQVNADSVILQTAFADAPVTCSLTDASLLRFPKKPEVGDAIQNVDKLFYTSRSLSGHVLFGGNQVKSSIQWESIGALKPARLTNNRTFHIERNNRSISKRDAFDTAQFPHVLHLKSGEIFPGQITSYDGSIVGFQSPFIGVQHLDSVDIKALEFSDRTHAPNIDRTKPVDDFDALTVTARGNAVFKVQLDGQGKDGKIIIKDTNINIDLNLKGGDQVIINEVIIRNEKDLKRNPAPDWIEIVPGNRKDLAVQPDQGWVVHHLSTSVLPDPEKDKADLKLERALTVPRLNRDNPPNHILVAKTGDMKRGKLLGLQGQTVQFDSKLREFSIPIDRVARIVNVSGDSGSRQRSTTQSEVRVRLTDGSILFFEPLEVQDDKLLGRSSIYGEVSIPVASIQYLHFGEKVKSFKAAFEKWIVRPAKEPTYGDRP